MARRQPNLGDFFADPAVLTKSRQILARQSAAFAEDAGFDSTALTCVLQLRFQFSCLGFET
jgi:hypothetical protein